MNLLHHHLRSEIRPMLALAVPMVLTELGWMSMSTVDILMVGPLGPESIGAVGVGSMLFLALAVFGIGILLGLDSLISQAFGAKKLDECRRWLLHGVVMSVCLALPLMLLVWLGLPFLDLWGFSAEVLRLTGPYLEIITWSTWPLLLYVALRRYLQAMGVVKPIMFTLLSANAINILANWVLIHGHFGAPALGVNGAGWATCISRLYMAISLVVAVFLHDAKSGHLFRQTAFRIELHRMWQLLRLGLPAAIQVTLEVGVFSASTALAGKLPAIALAAHQIVLNMASITFMVPLGMASAAAVRVGHAVGRIDPAGASRAAWTAVMLGVVFMAGAAALFLLVPAPLMRLFTTDATVITTGVSLLFVAAIMQMVDGLQGVLTGVFRGVGDTRTPMLWNLAGHWCLGLPLGYSLCFLWGVGVIGLWIGLSTGLTVVALILLAVWTNRARGLANWLSSDVRKS